MAPKRVTGSIKARGTALYAVIWIDGVRSRRTTGYTLGQEAEAQRFLDAAIEEIRKAEPEVAKAPAIVGSVQEWGEKWIEDRKVRGKLEWVHEESHLCHYLYPALGSRPLAEVTDLVMLDWARALEKTRGPSGKTPGPKYVRKITATVRALFKEAVRRHLIERTPCIWEDSDLPELEANARVIGAGFELSDVQTLISDDRIPEDRRMLYALEFLTGMRSGEAAARKWEDWTDESYRGDLGRLVARTAYNTRHRILKATKTRVEKWIPVHPALAAMLRWWRAEGFERFQGRPPTSEDLIVPSVMGKCRNVSSSWRNFSEDLRRVGIPHQRHYETRSTFINLAEGGGANPSDVSLLTHASVGQAKGLYRRIPQLWPRLCAAVQAIRIEAPAPVEVAPVQAATRAEIEPAEGPTHLPTHPVAESGGEDWKLPSFPVVAKTWNGGRAGESNPPAAPLSTTHRF